MHGLLKLRVFAGTLIAIALCRLTFTAAPRSHAQTAAGDPKTTPIPANTDWDQETQNAVNAINAYRAAQQPALPQLQVDAILQSTAAWRANDQFVTKNCLGKADQGVINCNNLDTLLRDTGQRLSDFGYEGAAIELFNYDSINGVTDITTGQSVVNPWQNATTSTTPGQTLLSPTSTAIGIARQCQTFSYGFACLWVAYFGTSLNQPFGPAVAQPPAAAPDGPSLTGTWTVDDFGSGAGGTLTLTQTGNKVTGTYSYADPSGCGTQNGTFTGALDPTTGLLNYSTNETGCNGGIGQTGQLVVSADGQSFMGVNSWNGTLTGP